MRAREILSEMKDRDAEPNRQHPGNFGVVVLLKQDKTLARLVACFANVPLGPDPDPDEECPRDTPPNARIRWLWSRLNPDPVPAWIATSGLPDAPHVRRAIQVAMDNRIVMPDGTVSRWATSFLVTSASGS